MFAFHKHQKDMFWIGKQAHTVADNGKVGLLVRYVV